MKKIFFGLVASLLSNFLFGQKACRSLEYQNQLIQNDPSIAVSQKAVENFVYSHNLYSARTEHPKVITIPVIVHILYHYPGENISDDQVRSQITALNRDYRKLNADTVKIPAAFKPLAADCGIQFQLATSDIRGGATTGIIHKYTPITKWTADDQIKFSSKMGDDAWDPKSYLNIWVGTLPGVLGYSSVPGGPADQDGVVISNAAFGILNGGPYDKGRTAVHEIGHWLGLKHLWGDTYCGDDSVADTPKQATFTNGCPTGVRTSCDNAPNGDMYMDYMDFTDDDCLVMFTEGQKQRMQTLFEPGGPRYSLLTSAGLSVPTIEEAPLPDNSPQWLHVKIYPNPASSELTINVEFDTRWVGKELTITNTLGQIEMRQVIISKIQQLDISKLMPGIYFISAKKDGGTILEKFVKF